MNTTTILEMLINSLTAKLAGYTMMANESGKVEVEPDAWEDALDDDFSDDDDELEGDLDEDEENSVSVDEIDDDDEDEDDLDLGAFDDDDEDDSIDHYEEFDEL